MVTRTQAEQKYAEYLHRTKLNELERSEKKLRVLREECMNEQKADQQKNGR